MRVIVADDSAVIREGLVRILTAGGETIAGQARTADELLALVDELVPDLAVVDIRMPPPATAGLQAAVRIRAVHRGRVGVLVLSLFLEPEYAMMLLAGGSGGVGYLLKDRVADATELLASARRVAAGGSAIDPAVVDEVVRGRSTQERLAVEAQVATIFSKLALEEHPNDNRRILAVLAYLDGRG